MTNYVHNSFIHCILAMTVVVVVVVVVAVVVPVRLLAEALLLVLEIVMD